MRREDFPKPIRLARRAIAWRKDDLDAWIDARERVDLSTLEDDGE
jgi:predicted DNA-binding transcriptional regulator AlpA